MANKTYRIRTNVSEDKVITTKLDQDVDFLEVLSLKISQKENYKVQSSNYGIIVGRVLANDAFGVPNCKVSVFIELSDDDKNNTEITSLYPYTSVNDKNRKNIRYNLLPSEYEGDCLRAVGTFPNKTILLDNDTEIEIFDKYWKYTTVTNNAGDYMIYGVPVGNQTIHVDLDLSDIGILSQKPRDMMYKGYTMSMFDSPSQFKSSTNLDNLCQIISQTKSVYVYPFWGDSEGEPVAISRCDIQINYKFEPTCVFFGSAITDDETNNINQKCSPTIDSGVNGKMTPLAGTIEMIRKTTDGYVEEYPIDANQLIDDDGVWCYQIPMNLDYIGTDEFGNIVKTDNPKKGIPTRTSVRFRFTLQESGNEGISRHRARYLVPNNPPITPNSTSNRPQFDNPSEFDNCYEFGSATPDEYFRDLYWNKVYSVKNYIPRIQTAILRITRKYSAIKTTNYSEGVNHAPFNNIRIRLPFMYRALCVVNKIVINMIAMINKSFICLLDNLWLFGHPFKIGCISFSFLGDGDGDTPVVYLPGCKCSRGQQYAECPEDEKTCNKVWGKGEIIDKMEQTLGEEYQIANLDFYNDWLNGSLYFPLWFWKKTKKRKFLFGLISIKAKNTYCDCDKKYKRLKIAESCAIPIKTIKNALEKGLILNAKDETKNWHKDFFKKKILHGIVKEFTNRAGLHVYYYTPGSITTMNYKGIKEATDYIRLYSTDIILLGSLGDYDIDGLPRLFENLPTTTANIPNVSVIIEENGVDPDDDDDTSMDDRQSDVDVDDEDLSANGVVEMSGMDWTRSGSKDGYQKGLFFDLSCNSAKTRLKSCINVERMCELGVTYDATYVNHSSNGRDFKEDTYEADGLITRHEIVDNESRAMFASMNGLGFSEKVTDENTNYKTYKMRYSYPIDLDGKLSQYTNSYTNMRQHKSYDNFDRDYLRFRLGKDVMAYSNKFVLYDNSFYFYFGLVPGSTAIDKFFTKYYSKCATNNKEPFSFDCELQSAKVCTDPVSGVNTDYGLIIIDLSKVKSPYSYTIKDEWGDIIIHEENMYDTTLYMGGALDDNGNYDFDKSNGNIKKGGYFRYKNPQSYDSDEYISSSAKTETLVENGIYTIEITDAKMMTASKVITLDNILIDANISTIGLGTKYYGYSENKSNDTANNSSDGDYVTSLNDGMTGNDSEIDSEDFSVDDVANIDFDSTDDGYESGSTESLLSDYSEAVITNTIIETTEDEPVEEKTQNYVDEKSLIHGNNKCGYILIDEILLDGQPYEVQQIIAINGDNVNSVKLKIGQKEINISGISSSGFILVCNKGSETGIVKLTITPKSFESFTDCSCDYSDNLYRDLIYNNNSGAAIPNGLINVSIDGHEITAKTINEPTYIKFSVWRPDDYTITLTQYCDNDWSFINTTHDVVTVENGEPFKLMLHDVPIKFMLGSASNENEYNKDYFCYNSGVGGNNVLHPGNIPGWFKLHLPSGYRFPSVSLDNTEVWGEYIKIAKDENGDFDSSTMINAIMYKFDAMFRMSNGCYITKESLPNLATTSVGGQKPILYIGSYPNYADEEDLSTFLVDTVGATDVLDNCPNIVGSNYCYKVTDKPNSSKWQTIKVNNSSNKYWTGRLYNDVNIRYFGVTTPVFNPQYSLHDKTQFWGIDDLNKRVKNLGNYFAGFTLNGGLTETNTDGTCGYHPELSARSECYPISASTFVMCGGNELTYEMKSNQIITNNEIIKHYFRAETVDRRLDYDLFIYMPPYAANGVKIVVGSDSNNKEYFINPMKIGRFYGTVYNGIEMAYEKAITNSNGITQYNVIGGNKSDGLEYYYDIADGSIKALINNKISSENKRFYESFIKCGTKKIDITNSYYSGFHNPNDIISLSKYSDKTAFTKFIDENTNEFNNVFSVSLDNNPTSTCYYKNEVNGDFSFDNYPTKRTTNLNGLPNTNKFTFNVTSCSFDMVSNILGNGEETSEAISYSGASSSNSDSTNTSEYVITASTKAGESTEVVIDTRDKVTIAHSFSESDFETSYDSYEIRYRSMKIDKDTILYKTDDGNKVKPSLISIDSQGKLTIISHFENPLDLRLRYTTSEDGYCETHSTYTSRPMVVNINDAEPYEVEGVKGANDKKTPKQTVCFGGKKNYFNEAINNSVSPNDIVKQIKTNCRAQFVGIDTLPSSLYARSEKVATNWIPYGGKFDQCFVTQTNFNRYPILVDAENKHCELVLDDADDAKKVIYRYGVYSYKEKKKTKYTSDWSDFFYYGSGTRLKKKKFYYHYQNTSVCGVIYERNYISTSDDNLGKNIKLLKLCNIIDLRPLLITFGGSSAEFEFVFYKVVVGIESRVDEGIINEAQQKLDIQEIKTIDDANRIVNYLNETYVAFLTTYIVKQEAKPPSDDKREFGGNGGATFYLYTTPFGNDYESHKWFSLFDEEAARSEEMNSQGEYDYTYSMDTCNIEWAGFCIDKQPTFIGSKITLSVNVDAATKIPYLLIDVKWPSSNTDTEGGGGTIASDVKTIADEINEYFDSNKNEKRAKDGVSIAIILKHKNGYYYTLPLKMAYSSKKKGESIFKGWN